MDKPIFFKKYLLAVVMLAVLAAQIIVPLPVHGADSAKAAEFTFSNDKITVSQDSAEDGEGEAAYEIDGTALTIQKSGTYLVSGSCGSGQIKIKKGTKNVTLMLGGITLTSEDSAPICCGKSSQVSIIAKEGTVNRLTDSAANNSTNNPDNANAENAVIKCKDGSNVTVGGTGEISITANGKNGIKSGASTEAEGSASLTIEDVALSLKAPVNDGVNAESLLTVKSGKLDISAADDALHCDYGLIVGQKNSQEGPEIQISECYEGLEGAEVTVYSGDIEIHSEDDGINAANSDLSGYDFSLEIAGGDVYVDAETGDGLDSNGSLTISGGKTEIFSTSQGDNAPIDSDGTFTITGGTVFTAGNSGMAQIPASGSQNYIAFGASMFGGQPPEGQPGEPPEGQGPSNDNQNKDDADSQTPPTGTPPQDGNANPPAQMGPQPEMPNQPSNISIAAGDALSITDDSNHTICKAAALRSANYVFYSDSALSKDATYTLYVNDTEAATATVEASMQQTPPSPPEGDNSNTGEDTDLSKSISVTLGKTKYVYNGKAKKPAVTVKAGSKKLTINKDYKVTYKNNKQVGTASVTVTGMGSYSGTLTKTFKIIPKGTAVSGTPTAKAKGFTVKWNKASQRVTGYEIQYSTAKSFAKKETATKTIRKSAVKKWTVSKLKEKTKYYVRVRTYKTVNGKAYYSNWSAARGVKTK